MWGRGAEFFFFSGIRKRLKPAKLNIPEKEKKSADRKPCGGGETPTTRGALTWENGIVRTAGPFNAGGRGRGPRRGNKRKLGRRATHFGRLSIEGAKTHNRVFPS